MPRGSKDKYSDKQKRMAQHIEEGYEDKGVSEDEAEKRAWATVNKQTGGAEGDGESKLSESEKEERRSDSAKRAAKTRKRRGTGSSKQTSPKKAASKRGRKPATKKSGATGGTKKSSSKTGSRSKKSQSKDGRKTSAKKSSTGTKSAAGRKKTTAKATSKSGGRKATAKGSSGRKKAQTRSDLQVALAPGKPAVRKRLQPQRKAQVESRLLLQRDRLLQRNLPVHANHRAQAEKVQAKHQAKPVPKRSRATNPQLANRHRRALQNLELARKLTPNQKPEQNAGVQGSRPKLAIRLLQLVTRAPKLKD